MSIECVKKIPDHMLARMTITTEKKGSVSEDKELCIHVRKFYSDKRQWSNQISLWKSDWKKQKVSEKGLAIILDSSFLSARPVQDSENALLLILTQCLLFGEISKIWLVVRKPVTWIQRAVRDAMMIEKARALAIQPGNVATPVMVANSIQSLFQEVPEVQLQIYNEQELEQMGAGLIMSVGASANHPPRMVVVVRGPQGCKASPGKAAATSKRICIVGKGITFDTGGLALKNFRGMLDMKYDKIGAIYGAHALREMMNQKVFDDHTLIGVFPLAENALSDRATRPGDVVRAYNGKTVEVTNPDAEGRLVLADAFAYVAKKWRPHVILDIATLTGHAEYINCWHYGYYYATPSDWKVELERITEKIGERMLAMPTWDDYDAILESNVADYVNSPEKCSDAYTAALFLKKFIPRGCDWLHIDLCHEHGEGFLRGNGMRTLIRAAECWLKSSLNKK